MKKIMTSGDAYLYCISVKDGKSIRKLITDSDDAYLYCRNVKDRESMRKLITDDSHIDELDNIKKSKKG
tara:strand:+ start:515 stop:721 length:207 start_codon:yes stop_codon:yes gene_type:complete